MKWTYERVSLLLIGITCIALIFMAFQIGQERAIPQNMTVTPIQGSQNLTVTPESNVTAICYSGTPGLISAVSRCEITCNGTIVRAENNTIYNVTAICSPEEEGVFCICVKENP